MHHRRWLRHGDPERTLIQPKGTLRIELERLMSIDSDECAIWPYGVTTSGYGSISINDHAKAVHVIACEKGNGRKPSPELHAAHSCGVRRCVNPRHLRWATAAENIADQLVHGTRPRGDTHWRRRVLADREARS